MSLLACQANIKISLCQDNILELFKFVEITASQFYWVEAPGEYDFIKTFILIYLASEILIFKLITRGLFIFRYSIVYNLICIIRWICYEMLAKRNTQKRYLNNLIPVLFVFVHRCYRREAIKNTLPLAVNGTLCPLQCLWSEKRAKNSLCSESR